MRVSQYQWTRGAGWSGGLGGDGLSPQIVLLFGEAAVLRESGPTAAIRSQWPGAHLLGCSTAGEICGVEVGDQTLVATAIEFAHTPVRVETVQLDAAGGSLGAGRQLGQAFERQGLVHVFVLSDGLEVNGSELVRGLTAELLDGVSVTGGLSADGASFAQTLVLSGDELGQGRVTALGLYGDRIHVGCASRGGWDPFGPERPVTRSEGNVLYELDGRNALKLYREYLGEHAEGLPATGLLFPLAIRAELQGAAVVRTVLAVDDEASSMTFAGDIPEGSFARLMMANVDRLVDGAAGAAQNSFEALGSEPPDLAILISCAGRKMVLKQRVEEELEAVREILGSATVLAGFYSYGELCPFTSQAPCELHNQTMTITAISER